jgi:hypothetical protein
MRFEGRTFSSDVCVELNCLFRQISWYSNFFLRILIIGSFKKAYMIPNFDIKMGSYKD